MRRVLFTLVAAAALAVAVAPAQAHRVRFTPTHAGGLTADELLAEIWIGSLSGRHIPFRGTCNTYVRTVVVPHPPLDGGPISCTMSRHQSVFFVFGSFCGSFEGIYDAAGQLACAVGSDEAIKHIAISVDGGAAFDIVAPRFEFATRQRKVVVAAGNDFDIPPQKATFRAHGWSALLKGLAPRRKPYTIVRTVVIEGVGEFAQTIYMTVTR